MPVVTNDFDYPGLNIKWGQPLKGDLSGKLPGPISVASIAGATSIVVNGPITANSVILKGATSGTITLKAAAVAGTNTLTLPAGTTDFSATGGTSQVLKQTSLGGSLTVAQLIFSDVGRGTNTNDSASAGNVGEIILSEVAISTGLSTGVSADLTSISLTAGDWDVWGVVGYAPAATTVVTILKAWINTTSATAPTFPNGGALVLTNISYPTGTTGQILPVGIKRLSLASTTTVFISTITVFSTSTLSGGAGIYARRVR